MQRCVRICKWQETIFHNSHAGTAVKPTALTWSKKKGVEDRFLGLKPTIFWANQTSAFSNFNSFFYIFLKLTLIHLLLLLFFEKSLSTFIASISKNKYFEKKIDLSNLSSKISNQHVKCLLIDSQIFIFLSLIIINY